MVSADPIPLHGPGSEPVTDHSFAQRLPALRRERGLTQQVLADRAGIHVTNLRRYEGGKAQPTLDVLRNLALALNTSADSLLFDDADRGPDEDLRLHLESLSRLDPDEKAAVVALIESMLLRHEARRLSIGGTTTAGPRAPRTSAQTAD